MECNHCGSKLGEIGCSNRYGGSFCSGTCAREDEVSKDIEYLNKKKPKQIPIKNLNYEDTPNDPIKPKHYHKNEIDVHGYLQKHFPKEGEYTVAEGFHIGNVIKYVSRYKNKNGLEDLKKAEANLKILIELEESK